MRRSWLLALLALATGCGGPGFSSALTDDAATDGSQQSDALVADSQSAEATGRLDSASADAAFLDAASGDADSQSDTASDSTGEAETSAEAAMPDGGTEQDASADARESGTPEAGLDTGAGDSSPDVQDAQPDVAAEACAPVLYFLDGDGDGYGGTSTSRGCTPPTTGTWVTVGGDCDDSNATVNPGQTAYFAVGYAPPGTTTVSFDYNCDGHETESGNPPKASCQIVDLSCTGSGYLEATPVRSGPGVDPFCDSTEAVTCALTDLVCQAGTPYTLAPITCH